MMNLSRYFSVYDEDITLYWYLLNPKSWKDFLERYLENIAQYE